MIVTIIIILLLAGITISSLTGSGLFGKSELAKKKSEISKMQEELQMKIFELRIEEEGNGNAFSKEALTKLNNEEIEVGSTESFPVEIIYGKYKFEVDENFVVKYVGDIEETDDDEDIGIPEEPVEPEVPVEPDGPTHIEEVPEGWIGIYNETDLRNVANDLTKNYIVMADIAVTSEWAPLGTSKTASFRGILEGNNYKITGLRNAESTTTDYQGLFGYIGSKGKVSNLTIENVEIYGGSYVGALVGYNEGTLENTTVSGEESKIKGVKYVGGLAGSSGGTITTANVKVEGIYVSGSYVGGLVGSGSGTITNAKTSGNIYVEASGVNNIGGLIGVASGKIENCYSEVEIGVINTTITGVYNVGGLVGQNSATINKAASKGNITTGGSTMGGLIGYNNGALSNVYSTGKVEGGVSASNIGGLIGYNYNYRGQAPITNAYTISEVTGGSSYVGGLIGQGSGTITSAYWTSSLAGVTTSSGGTELTLDNMKLQSSYEGWDFESGTMWIMKTYPELIF